MSGSHHSSVILNSGNNSKETYGKSSYRSKTSTKTKGFENKQVYIDKSTKINYGSFKVKHFGEQKTSRIMKRGT
jgi:hypothetical protein